MRVQIRAGNPLRGRLQLPGDKSCSHRAALFAALADGRSTIRGYAPGQDGASTLRCLAALGAEVEQVGSNVAIRGHGPQLREPTDILDAGNSGTTARLLCGILAGQPFASVLNGDASLRRRPMARVTDPLRRMGAQVLGRGNGGFLPLAIGGPGRTDDVGRAAPGGAAQGAGCDHPGAGAAGGRLHGIEHLSPVASAQLKSAVLLAGCFADGPTTVCEPTASRDHTERMLAWLGAVLDTAPGRVILRQPPTFRPFDLAIPGDVSAAAFFLAAAALLPGSQVRLEAVGVNPTRTGFLDALEQMGAVVAQQNRDHAGPEPVADLLLEGQPGDGGLRCLTIGGAMVPRLIDELPLVAVLATQARGETLIRDAGELRVKESDRIHTVCTALSAMGARVVEQPDGLRVDGPVRLHGAALHAQGDHRLAMALAVAGLLAEGETVIDGAEAAAVSHPNFWRDLRSLGAEVHVDEG